MPRAPRTFLPGTPLHIIQRGNNREACFHGHQDYCLYLRKLGEYSREFGVAIHSYVLMTNHVHLQVTPDDAAGPSKLMQALGRSYVRYINSRYTRTGTLWEGRFKACMIDSDAYFLTVSRYIELNPVRAGMVDHPAEYAWSSYRANALGYDSKLLTPHVVYLALGANPIARCSRYERLFPANLPDSVLNEIRLASNKALLLGGARFRQQIEDQLGYRLPPMARGGDRRSAKFKVL